MTETWDHLARTIGRKAVMNPAITDRELDAETARQIPVLRNAIRPFLNGREKTALDFGCGYGRFTPMLANLIDGRAVGFDPSAEMVRAGRGHLSVDYVTCPVDQFFDENRKTETHYDLILAFAVLGEPSMPLWDTTLGLAGLLSDDGLLAVVEHVVPRPDPKRWWKFQEPGFYESTFRACGVELQEVGTVSQLEDTMTIYAGGLIQPRA